MADKKVIIIDHGGQLGNQLWNFAGIYAYCLEKGYACQSPAFFHYAHYFPAIKTGLIPRYFFDPLFNLFPRKRFTLNRLYRRYLELKFGQKKLAQAVRSSDEQGGMELFFLPPTENPNQEQQEKLARVESSAGDILFSGYAFRNPAGLVKYQRQLVEYFSPRRNIRSYAENLIAKARTKYSKIIGVHIRQNDFRDFNGGEYYFPPEKVALILKDFVEKTGLKNTCFVIASDEKIKPEIFSGLNVIFSSGKIMEDLFALAKTDMIIGANSTFGAFAAYYGNIPLAIFSAEPIDWNFYLEQKKFFFNQKSIANLPHLLKPSTA